MSLEPSLNLQLYAGRKRVAAKCDAMMLEPARSGPRHSPMPHAHFFSAIHSEIIARDLAITQTIHTLTSKDDMYFGMSEIHSTDDLFVPVICWASSHNQRVSAKLYVGAGVREFNSLVITTEIPVVSRQVGDFAGRLPDQISQALEEFDMLARQQHIAFDQFIATKLVDMDAECCIIDMIRQDIVPASKSKQIIDAWDDPQYDSLAKTKNVWRLFCAVVDALKPRGDTDAVSALVHRSPQVVLYCKNLVMERLR